MSPPSSKLDPSIIAQLSELEAVRPGTLRSIATQFLSQADTLTKTLADTPDGDHEAIRRDAHLFKGSCLSLGASELASLCAKIEAGAKAGQSTAAERGRLDAALAAVRPELEALS